MIDSTPGLDEQGAPLPMQENTLLTATGLIRRLGKLATQPP